jgi:hypothetical protein
MPNPKILAVARGTLDTDVTATTPRGTSDVRVIVVSAARVVLVRTVRTYLQSLLGFLGATVVGAIPSDPLAPPDAWAKLATAAGLALFPAVCAAIQNVLELLARLDTSNPELRG